MKAGQVPTPVWFIREATPKEDSRRLKTALTLAALGVPMWLILGFTVGPAWALAVTAAWATFFRVYDDLCVNSRVNRLEARCRDLESRLQPIDGRDLWRDGWRDGPPLDEGPDP